MPYNAIKLKTNHLFITSTYRDLAGFLAPLDPAPEAGRVASSASSGSTF